MSTFLMLASRALSTAFWSAARLLETSFFCDSMLAKPTWTRLVHAFCRTWGFSPFLKKASSPAFSLVLSAVKYVGLRNLLDRSSRLRR